jgi:hypothetical protein
MSDVVLRFSVDTPQVAQMFGRFLTAFIESRTQDVERFAAANADAPYVMIKTDVDQAGEVRVLTFQEPGAATAFSRGWTELLKRDQRRRA